jgi:hypothetical protein
LAPVLDCRAELPSRIAVSNFPGGGRVVVSGYSRRLTAAGTACVSRFCKMFDIAWLASAIWGYG